MYDPASCVVIIVDVQNDYCRPEGALGIGGAPTAAVTEMLPRLHKLLTAARAAGTHVVFLKTVHEDATDSATWKGRDVNRRSPICRAGTWGSAFTEVEPRSSEPVVLKHRYSGFIHTRLESVLHTLGARTLLMTGVSTNVCVESTARDGFMLDYEIVLIDDCCAAYSRAEHDAARHNIGSYFGTVTMSQTVIAAWQPAVHESRIEVPTALPANG